MHVVVAASFSALLSEIKRAFSKYGITYYTQEYEFAIIAIPNVHCVIFVVLPN